MSAQSAGSFNRNGPVNVANRAGKWRGRTRDAGLRAATLEYFSELGRHRAGGKLPRLGHPFVDERLGILEDIAATTFKARTLCEGASHTLSARPGGALHFHSHTRGELRALRVMAELSGRQACGCLVYAAGLSKARAKKSFQPVIDEARRRREQRAQMERWLRPGLDRVNTEAQPAELLRVKWHGRVEKLLTRLSYRHEKHGVSFMAKKAQAPARVVWDGKLREVTLLFDWPWCRLVLAGRAMFGDRLALSFTPHVRDARLAEVHLVEMQLQAERVPVHVEVVMRPRTPEEQAKAPAAPADTEIVTKTRLREVVTGVKVVRRVVKFEPAGRFGEAGWRVIE